MSRPDNVYVLRTAARAAAVEPAAARVPLWNLPAACHCPVIGSCLGTDLLRRLLDDLFEGQSDLADFDLHAGVVRECGSRNRVSELLQHELDRRHADAVHRLADADAEAVLAEAWVRAAGSGDVAGTFWAVVTHPRCSVALMEQLLRDLHMIQHRAMEVLHSHLERGDRLAADNVRLRAELAAKARECELLQGAMAARAGRHPWQWRRFFAGSGAPGRVPAATPR